MVTAYLFDRRQGKSVEDWAESLHGLDKNQVLWIDLMDASEDEAAEVLDTLDLGDAEGLRLGDPEGKPGIEQHEGHLRVTAVAVSDAERDPARERIVVDCFLGSNWVLTAHSAEIAVLDDFRERRRRKGRNRPTRRALVSLDTPGVGRNQLSPRLRRDRRDARSSSTWRHSQHPSNDPEEEIETARRRSPSSRPTPADARAPPRGVRGAEPLRVRPALLGGIGRAVRRTHGESRRCARLRTRCEGWDRKLVRRPDRPAQNTGRTRS